MIERKPFTPEDYRIGREGAKGTSDYPTQGTSPRDALHMDSEGKRRRNVITRGRIDRSEPLSETLNPEEALIEAEEALQDTEDEETENENGVAGDQDSKDAETESDSNSAIDALSTELNFKNVLIEKEGVKEFKKDEKDEAEKDVGVVGKNGSAEEAYDPMVLHELRGGIDSKRLTVGPGAARQQEKKYPLRNWHNPRKHRGTFKPKGKKPEHLPKASSF